MNYKLNFSESLKEIMLDRQITPEVLSKAISYNQIYHWLSGDYIPSFSNLIKIADYFQCSLDYLIGKSDDNLIKSFKECPLFSERLHNVIKKKEFTIYKLSKLSKIDKRTIYDWLNNLYCPQLENLLKLSNAFECSLDFLVGREI